MKVSMDGASADAGSPIARIGFVPRLVFVVALLAACYSPDAHDCTLACNADSDCISSQACTSDHLCASPSIATCAERTVSDAGTASSLPDAKTHPRPLDAQPDGGTHAPPPDASLPPPDARVPPPLDAGASTVQLKVIISGNGSVHVSVGADCSHGTCTYSLDEGSPVTLTAVNRGNHVFQAWQGAPCAGQGQTCQFTASAPVTTASVVFDHDH